MFDRYPHALVVGGTGMLRGAALHLARTSVVSVIARDTGNLESLVRDSGGWVRAISVDYRDTGALVAALRNSIERDSTIDLAVCWIHSDAPDALRAIVDTIGREAMPPKLFHVLGSGMTPARELSGVAHRTVMLGRIVEPGGGWRWLTNDEISRGVIDAIETNRETSVVGVV